MAVYTQQRRVEYEGPGPATLAVPFPFDAPGDLVVTKVVGDSETTLVRGRDYEVSGGRPASGTVTLSAPMQAGEAYVIRRVVPLTQPVDLVSQGPYDPRVIAQALDRATMQIQQLAACDCGGGSGGGGCDCPDADPGEPDTVEPDPQNPGGIIVIPGDPSTGRPGLITVEQLRRIFAHLDWGSLRHNVADIDGLQAELDTKLTASALVPIQDEISQVQAEVATKASLEHTHTFAEITGKPTTLQGYGITDGVTQGELAAAVNGLAPTNSPDFTGTPKVDGYPILTTRSDLDYARLTNRPDSLAGYGILDAYTKAQVEALIAQGGGGGGGSARRQVTTILRFAQEATLKHEDNHGDLDQFSIWLESYVDGGLMPLDTITDLSGFTHLRLSCVCPEQSGWEFDPPGSEAYDLRLGLSLQGTDATHLEALKITNGAGVRRELPGDQHVWAFQGSLVEIPEAWRGEGVLVSVDRNIVGHKQDWNYRKTFYGFFVELRIDAIFDPEAA